MASEAAIARLAALLLQRWGEVQTALGLAPGAVSLRWDIGPYAHFKKRRGYAVTFHLNSTTCHLRFASKTLTAPFQRVDGLIRHELGHVTDMLIEKKILDKWAIGRRVKLPKTPERRADAIAEAIWGSPIFYDADLVQTTCEIGTVCPRPKRLGL